MGKKKRPPTLKSDPGSVHFEVNEEDATLFRQYVESEIPSFSEAEQPDDEPHAAATRRNKSEAMTEVDLHGLNVVEAKRLVDQTFRSLQAKQRFGLRIITGRGLHSGPEGAVLPGEIYGYIQARYGQYIEKIDESPDEVRLNNIPVRGHFCVWFRCK